MPAVGSTAVDVLREFQYSLAKLDPVVAAYFQFDPRSNRIILTTLLDDFDPFAEEHLANVELLLTRTYQDFAFDFTTVHLKGRDPQTFVPTQASVVIDRLKSQK